MDPLVQSPKRFFPNLDAMRFYAFLVVFISHAALFLGYENQTKLFTNMKTYLLANGDVGVSFFFVLSGFLITYILLTEKEKTATVSLKSFYHKRILRIWPVYFTALILGFFVLPYFAHLLIGTASLPFTPNAPFNVLPKYLFFLANFSLAFHGGASVPADILWSISVEEQFYLVWPLLVMLTPSKHLPKVLLGIIAVSSVYKYLYAYNWAVIAYSTFSVMSDLCIGAFLGWIIVYRQDLVLKFKEMKRSYIYSAYIGAIFLIIIRHWYIPFLYPYKILFPSIIMIASPLLAILFALIIFEQNESSNSFFKAGNMKISTYLGKISYGLYAYHMIAVALVLSLAAKLLISFSYGSISRWLSFGVLSLFLTICFAIVSFRYMESWFLKRKPSN